MDPKYMLEQKGVSFPEGAYVLYHPLKGQPEHETPRGQFVVHNTPKQLKAISAIIADYNKKAAPSEPEAPLLYKQTWRVPKSYLEDHDEVDDMGDLWRADAQISITIMTSVRFLDVEGASASLKKGKLTIIHTQERLERMQEYLEGPFTQMGKTTPISIEDANRLKPKKRKSKFKTKDGRVLDIDELYDAYEGKGSKGKK